MYCDAASEMLMIAANQGDVEQCQSLVLEARASLEHRNTLGETCLHVAAARGLVSVVELLLALGADPNVATYTLYGGATPLHVAVRTCRSIRLAQTLLERHADANISDALGKTPLHHAVCNRDAVMVELLVRHGSSIDCPDITGKYPRDYAIDLCFTQVVPLLSPAALDGEAPPPPLTFKQKLELDGKRIVWKPTKAGTGK
jgi:ankyrin repeat protein